MVSYGANLMKSSGVQERELAYYEDLYGGYGVEHFAKPAVVEFRKYLVARILRRTQAGSDSKVLSIGCGLGDTELLLAPHVGHVTGIDLSPTAIREATRAAKTKGVKNVRFSEGRWPHPDLAPGSFDVVLAIFFLHHLPDSELDAFPGQLSPLLTENGRFYALEPSARRLSGFLGKLIVPHLMKKYQTEDERQLLPRRTAAPFRQAGFTVCTSWFDFCSTPLAGLFPSWAAGYKVARGLDTALTACPGVRALSSNFELIAYREARPRIAESIST
jgi:ubiquinone/menaquinone biosynthesis C-methylase UbiE